jgi:hypothetical protein
MFVHGCRHSQDALPHERERISTYLARIIHERPGRVARRFQRVATIEPWTIRLDGRGG